MGWQTFNDRLALLLLLLIPSLWLFQLLTARPLSGEVNGGLMVTWTLVVQYYFRRAPPNGVP